MDNPAPGKKRLNYDIGHIIFLIVILILVISAAGAIVYSSKRYVSLGTEYNEKVREVQQKTKEVADLQQQIIDKDDEIERLQAEQRARSSDRDTQQETDALKKELEEAQKELASLKDYSRCDDLLQEYKGEYNDALDRLYEKTKDICWELYSGGTTYDDRRQFKRMIDAEVNVDEYKAGGNVTN